MATTPPRTAPTHLIRRLAATLIVGFALLAVLAGSTRGASLRPADSASRCARIAFARQSDDVAFNISASRASCSLVRAVASGSPPTWPVTPAKRTYAARGFTCVGRLVLPNGMAYEHYVCVRHGAKIVFDRA